MVVITDTFEDPRVNLSPLVVQGPKMRSYAGAPIQTEAGETIGTICVMGPEPKGFNGAQVGALWALSRQVATYLGLRPRSEGSAQEIAESRDDADQRARDYSKRIRQMVEQMPAALWSTDEGLRLTMTLGGGLEAMHLRASEVVGKTLAEIFGTDDPTFPPTAAHVNALSGEPSGLVRWTAWGHTMEIRVVPQFDDDGAIVGTLGVGVDVTERMRMGEAIESFEDTVRTMLEAASSAAPSGGNGADAHDRPGSDTVFEGLHRQSA
jgi:PAS domain-containing protein